jgi:hypothetical protein
MPNHVSNAIKFTSELSDFQKQVLLGILHTKCICRYFHPRPPELEGTISPSKPSTELIKKYGASDWYDWSINNWGTKWGCYDFEWDADTLSLLYTTAWSPVSDQVILSLLSVFPNFEYSWEEEQGFGKAYEFAKGEQIYYEEWESPAFANSFEGVELWDLDISYLASDYTKEGNTYKAGFYDQWDLESFISEEPPESLVRLLEAK